MRNRKSQSRYSNTLLFDVTEEALDYIEANNPSAADHPSLLRLAGLSLNQNESIRGMLAALWSTRPRSVAQELFR